MTLETFALTTDKRDYFKEAVAYLNSKFRNQEDMEQRIGVHLLDYARSVGATVEESEPGAFAIIAPGAVKVRHL